ncbi:MAG: hypothetical protein AB1403_19235 [Candidatus Riflebacteria bacterium]
MLFLRRGNCLVILALMAACLIGGFYFLLREPQKDAPPSKKPVIKSFKHDISGKWQAKLVKINPPPRSKPGYKPPWMLSNYSDFDASIEIGRDFYVKHLKWVEIRGHTTYQAVEWFTPDRWKFFERESSRGQSEIQGESERNGKNLKIKYIGRPTNLVRECSLEYNQLADVPPKYQFDGGFREGKTSSEIESQVMLYAPPMSSKKIDGKKFKIEITSHGFQLANRDFSIDGFVNDEIMKILYGYSFVKFEHLKKFNISRIRGGVLKDLHIKGYPSAVVISINNCICQFWFGASSQEGDRAFVEIGANTEIFLDKVHDAYKKARVVFTSDGKGKLFTHDGIMEYDLSR